VLFPTHIALTLKFSCQANFTRAFREAAGQTPAQYRRSVGLNAAEPMLRGYWHLAGAQAEGPFQLPRPAALTLSTFPKDEMRENFIDTTFDCL
jgi:hypothetical protein